MSTESRFVKWVHRFAKRMEETGPKPYPSRKWTLHNPLDKPPIRFAMWKAKKMNALERDMWLLNLRIYQMQKQRHQSPHFKSTSL